MLISSVDHVFSMARNTENKHSWPDPSPQSSVPVEKGNIEEREEDRVDNKNYEPGWLDH